MALKNLPFSALLPNVFSSEMEKKERGAANPLLEPLPAAKTQHISPELLLQTPNKTRTHYLLKPKGRGSMN